MKRSRPNSSSISQQGASLSLSRYRATDARKVIENTFTLRILFSLIGAVLFSIDIFGVVTNV
jgi:hypothetical protein